MPGFNVKVPQYLAVEGRLMMFPLFPYEFTQMRILFSVGRKDERPPLAGMLLPDFRDRFASARSSRQSVIPFMTGTGRYDTSLTRCEGAFLSSSSPNEVLKLGPPRLELKSFHLTEAIPLC